MTVTEAYKKLKACIGDMKVVKCCEYDTLFTFLVMPENIENGIDENYVLTSPISVNKVTGEIRDFKPFLIPLDEYKRGIEVSNYK